MGEGSASSPLQSTREEEKSLLPHPDDLRAIYTPVLAWTNRNVLAFGLIIRIALFGYGVLHDALLEVPYTDVDYFVFSDAAAKVHEGKSPFERKTYRYSPFLAWMLLPNETVGKWWGKALFVIFDMLVGKLVGVFLEAQAGLTKRDSALLLSLWMLNPIVVNVSTRGNAEALICFFVVAAISCLYAKRGTAAGVFLGIATHLKVYPIIYAPVFLFYLAEGGVEFSLLTLSVAKVWRLGVGVMKSKQAWLFAIGFALSFSICTYASYSMYGDEYMEEALLYHAKRTDHKHNFSVYFHLFYLLADTDLGALVSKMCFAPQFLITAAIGFATFKSPALAMFGQTLVFVAFNKVYTVQYFCWYFCLLPLAAAEARLSRRHVAVMMLAGGVSLVLWLAGAYQIEFKSLPYFDMVTAASALCLLSQCYIAAVFLRHRKME
uniref:GPI mannosyltransferase 1 n=1 Tax=Palpitomonas bilix TaxID=652834 RepID=A0A7S3LVZ2_9EUKA|mmetsp:Transcript_5605/g.13037  ORF Transcript_5605/g.13037 Transcript_5605/m.13037 type:complete len:434 (+) Transcript_5605:351-1652(+)